MLNFANILDAIAGRKCYGNWTKNEKNDHVHSHSEAQKQGHIQKKFEMVSADAEMVSAD